MIYLRSCQDVLSFFIDSSVISGPTFAHCTNVSTTNNSVKLRIFAHEHPKISSWSVSCGNIFDWSVKRSKVGFSFPSLSSMISVTANSLLKKFCFVFWFDLKNEHWTHTTITKSYLDYNSLLITDCKYRQTFFKICSLKMWVKMAWVQKLHVEIHTSTAICVPKEIWQKWACTWVTIWSK